MAFQMNVSYMDSLWGPPFRLLISYRRFFPLGYSDLGVKLATHVQPVLRFSGRDARRSSRRLSVFVRKLLSASSRKPQMTVYTGRVSESGDLKNVMDSKFFHLFSFNTHEHNVCKRI
jgi:hypothetical protein